MFAYSLVNFPFVIYAISFLKDLLVSILKSGPVPGHVAFVMDGNRRFAKVQGVALKEGHKAGAETLASVSLI
ncbi:unnamed protein product [Kuraishia capsulata CBS 1993]|uniref:Uncharacterized protein n=1 Tax=Kuraishia capsulata CBS 1993 TaxID=1382522 RepID=W6MXB8_9ASCO|nr:uncharacterized protein KUCA_T00004599001 [Kuraishia capsulata CBS 1993]CDK28615.1 unnamed protein product [Kuraishia capsulata CBS 1993]